ncbi:MAG: D-alanine--D-alanine ligase [Pseudomonadota bacterium]
MKVGLTYDLRDDYLARGFKEEDVAEFDSRRTIEGLESALNTLGYQTQRIGHLQALVESLVRGETWDLVFNLAEGWRGFGREAQIPALLEAYNIPYTFSDPLTLSLSLHKGMAKRVVRDVGLPTPDFLVVESADQAMSLTVELPYPLFVKPVAEGTGKGISAASRIDDPGQLASACLSLLAKYGQPVLVETFLPGREFTVAVAGTGPEAEVLGTMEVFLQEGAEEGVYSYFKKENCEEVVVYKLAEDEAAGKSAEVALAAYRALGCRDAGRVDLRLDAEGRPNFMEVNPLAGLHPEHSDLPIICNLTGLGYLELINRIMRSAVERNGLGRQRAA